MILITHDPKDAEVFGERVLHLHDGVIDEGENSFQDESVIA